MPVPVALLPAEERWSLTLQAAPSAPAAWTARSVFVPTIDGQLIALDRRTGERRWSVPVETTVAPIVADDVVLVATPTTILAIAEDDGGVRWRADGMYGRLHASGDLTFAATVVPDANRQASIVARRVADGQVVWDEETGTPGAIVGMAADADALYAVTEGHRVVGLARRTGVLEWTRELPGTLGPPAVARDRVFVGSDENAFFALDAKSGSVEWRVRTGGDVVGAVSDGDRVFMVALDNVLRALNRSNGHQQWKQALPTRPVSAPVVGGGALLVPGLAPVVSAFNGRTGTAFGEHRALGDTSLVGPPLVDPLPETFGVSMVFVLRDGRVFGLAPVELLFREARLEPLLVPPGRALTRETPPWQAPAAPPPVRAGSDR